MKGAIPFLIANFHVETVLKSRAALRSEVDSAAANDAAATLIAPSVELHVTAIEYCVDGWIVTLGEAMRHHEKRRAHGEEVHQHHCQKCRRRDPGRPRGSGCLDEHDIFKDEYRVSF